MQKRAVQFYNVTMSVQSIDKMQERARELLLERSDFNVGAAWVEAVMEHLLNNELLSTKLNNVDYFLNGEKRR